MTDLLGTVKYSPPILHFVFESVPFMRSFLYGHIF